ncbi:MAG TPA: HD domain-containing protein, partial [Xanthomonadales bacterium]|nr:HD domain-containing protein [Xanthomonadales bacterium]
MTSKQADTTQALQQWLDGYRHSVGESAQICSAVLDGVLAGALDGPGGQAQLLEILRILEDLSADPRTMCCAMLWVAHQHGEDLAGWRAKLPDGVVKLLDELLRLKQTESENIPPGTERSAEGLRRLLLALVRDVRVVLVALAWQLVLLRGARSGDDAARSLARETMLIHAPLANRLGVWQLKWELEDLAFRYQEPEAYQRVARQVAERRSDRERFIGQFISRLEHALSEAGIEAEVLVRPNHIYSIWKTMLRKGAEFGEIYDVYAIRVLVDEVRDCYAALG